MVICSVPGCAAKGTRFFHSFPKDADIRKKWVMNTKTFHLTEKQLNSYGTVCKHHFRESDFEINARGQQGLKKGALPSVNLPKGLLDLNGSTYGDYALTSADEYVPRKRQRKQETIEADAEQVLKDIDDLLTSSENIEAVVDVNCLETDLQEVVLVDKSQFVTTSVSQFKAYQKVADDCRMYEQKILEYEKVVKEMQQKEKRNQLAICKLLNKDQINQKKVKKLRQELKDAKSQKKANILKYLNKIFNSEQLAFFSMQLKNSGKKSKGRRYSTEEKSLALALYKHSPASYREMRKIFILPVKRTLGQFSARLAFSAAIDDKLFTHIAEKVKDLSELDNYCTLSWDEVSLKQHLDYNVGKDEIDGFVEMFDGLFSRY